MINEEIIKIKEIIEEELHPLAIYLFGSYAKDTFKDHSDYDFFILIPDSMTDNIMDYRIKVKNRIWDEEITNKRIDLFFTRESTYNECRQFDSSIEAEIDRTGIKL